jgi:hypothetical protein
MTTETNVQLALAEIAEKIRARQRKTAEDLIDTGRELIETRDMLGHGKWGVWLDEELGWDYRTAIRHMRVAQLAEKVGFAKLANLLPSILYMLTEPKTPNGALNDVLERVEKGERITVKVAEEIIREWRIEEEKTKKNPKYPIKDVLESEPEEPKEIKVKTTIGSATTFIRSNFNPKEIQKIIKAATKDTNRPDAVPMLTSFLWVRDAHREGKHHGLMFTEGKANEYYPHYLVHEGWIYSYNDHERIIAASPFPFDGTFRVTTGGMGLALEMIQNPVIEIDRGEVVIRSADASDDRARNITVRTGACTDPEVIFESFPNIRNEMVGVRYPTPDGFISAIRQQWANIPGGGDWYDKGTFTRTTIMVYGSTVRGPDGEFQKYHEVIIEVPDLPWETNFEFTLEAAKFIARKDEDPVEIVLDVRESKREPNPDGKRLVSEIIFVYEDGSWMATAIGEIKNVEPTPKPKKKQKRLKKDV